MWYLLVRFHVTLWWTQHYIYPKPPFGWSLVVLFGWNPKLQNLSRYRVNLVNDFNFHFQKLPSFLMSVDWNSSQMAWLHRQGIATVCKWGLCENRKTGRVQLADLCTEIWINRLLVMTSSQTAVRLCLEGLTRFLTKHSVALWTQESRSYFNSISDKMSFF